jgi:hypothetical protein
MPEKLLEFADDMLEVLSKHKFIDDLAKRDYKIRREFDKLVKEDKIPSERAKNLLAEKYFVSFKHIETIVYGLKHKKELPKT